MNFEKMHADFYANNPDFIERDKTLASRLIGAIKNAEVRDDYSPFREDFGPIMIEVPQDGFFSDFIMEMIGGDKLINVEPLDRSDGQIKIDLLEVMSMLAETLDGLAHSSTI